MEYVVSAFLGMLRWWLNRNRPCTAEEIDRLFQVLSLRGITACIPPAQVQDEHRQLRAEALTRACSLSGAPGLGVHQIEV